MPRLYFYAVGCATFTVPFQCIVSAGGGGMRGLGAPRAACNGTCRFISIQRLANLCVLAACAHGLLVVAVPKRRQRMCCMFVWSCDADGFGAPLSISN